MFDHLLELSRSDDSNKWSNIEFGEEMGNLEKKIYTFSGAMDIIHNHVNYMFTVTILYPSIPIEVRVVSTLQVQGELGHFFFVDP